MLVAVAIVQMLEVVDIDEEQRERMFHPSRTVPFRTEYLIEASTVGDLGQCVLQRYLFHLVASLLERLVGD